MTSIASRSPTSSRCELPVVELLKYWWPVLRSSCGCCINNNTGLAGCLMCIGNAPPDAGRGIQCRQLLAVSFYGPESCWQSPSCTYHPATGGDESATPLLR